MAQVTEDQEVEALKALAGVLTTSIGDLRRSAADRHALNDSVAAVLACLPETPHIPDDRIGAALALIVHARPDAAELGPALAKYVAKFMTVARSVAHIKAGDAHAEGGTH